MRVFDLIGTVDAVANYDELAGEVIASGTLDGELTGDCLSDAVLETVVLPRDGTVQVVDMELWIGGAFVQRRQIHAEMSVERDYDNIVQGWNFGTPLETPTGVFGTPFACIGPAIGLDEVDIYGIYDTPSGIIRIPLIRNGIVDNSHREAGENGIMETFTGVDGGGRFDGVKITKQFPPGHGLYRGRVGREIMRSVGDDQVSFDDGGRMNQELQLVDAEPFPPLAEIFEVENRKLLKDSDGFWINPRVGRIRPEETAIFSFEERDVLRVSTVSLDSMANVITLVIANGTKQKTKDACGTVWTTETSYEYRSPYAPIRSNYRQNVDGSFTALTQPTAGADPYLVKKTEITREHRCDVLMSETTKVWEMARRQTTRHTWTDLGVAWDTSDDGWVPRQCYTDDNSPDIGAGPAYADQDESLLLTSLQVVVYDYIHSDYRGMDFSGGGGGSVLHPASARLLPPYASLRDYGPLTNEAQRPQYGQALAVSTYYARLGHVVGAVKSRSISSLPAWETVQPVLGREIWGDGGGNYNTNSNFQWFPILPGVTSPSNTDALIPWSMSSNVYYGDDNNFLYQEDFYEWEWEAARGSTFYFGENDTRGAENQDGQLVRSEIKKYTKTGTTHSENVTSTNHMTGYVAQRNDRGLSGSMPAIERLDFVEPNTNIYQDGEDTELLKKASRTDTEQITVTVPFDFFLTCHVPKEVVVEFPWAENEDELRKMAEALAQESAAMPVFFTLPANFLIREAMPIHLIYRPLAIDHDIRVKAVKWKRAPEKPLLTEVEARLYGW